MEERTADLSAERKAVIDELIASGIPYDRIYPKHPTLNRCAASGLPLLESDETLFDDETNELVLRCLMLPPRPEDPDDIDAGGQCCADKEMPF